MTIRHTLWLFTLTALVLSIITCCTREAQKAENVSVARLEKVRRESISFPVRTAGYVRQKEVIPLAFKTGGIIQKISVEEGDSVKKGDVLARLDPSEIEARVNQARSSVAKTRRDFERAKGLYNDRVATLEQVQNSRTVFEVACSRLKVAEFNLLHSTITAPSNGTILKRYKEENELVAQGMPVLVFGATDKNWIVRTGIADKDLVRLKTGDYADVYFDAFPGANFSAVVSQISEAPDLKTSLFGIELTLENRPERITAGLIVKIDIYPSQKKEVFLVPIGSLVESDGDRGVVFTVDRVTLQAIRVPVRIYQIYRDRIALSSGLEHTNEIVVSGASYLKNGTKVKILGQDLN